jgi:hypothetical protein
MERQLGLFGDLDLGPQRENQYGFPCEDRRPIARESDKETSHEAATNVQLKLVGLRAVFYHVLKSLGKATANEVGAAAVGAGLVKNAESVRKRAQEVVDLHLAVECGTRVCGVTGNSATLYEAVE